MNSRAQTGASVGTAREMVRYVRSGLRKSVAISRISARTGGAVRFRLRDDALIVKVSRDRRAEQIRVIDGDAFDPERSGLEFRIPLDGLVPGGTVRVERLYAISTPR